MNLDRQVCSRARLSRDARFDGKFFIAVLSTGIYCRPICTARASKEENVRYYPSAAAAAGAGFRPCLRCRPECSPGTPAWSGTSSTVSRALRLISEGGLEDGGMEALAERLGVGGRHLRRLFLKHLGATPNAVAQTRRLHFAKKLIDETSLSMTQVAVASGFGSVRRFNAAIRQVYNRTPLQIRSLARRAAVEPENQYLLRLPFRPPYAWKSVLAFLADHAIPGVEFVEQNTYRRSISWNRTHGYFEVSLDASGSSLAARVQFGDSSALYFIVERIRAMFDVSADWSVIVQSLKSDPALADIAEAEPGLRVPGCWNGFELATAAILGQHVSLECAAALAGRLVQALGTPIPPMSGVAYLFPSPETLATADLASIGLPPSQAATIRALARAVCDGRISFDQIVETDAFLGRLREIPGIGRWTAQYVAMRALGEPDAFPNGEPGMVRGLPEKTAGEIERRAEAWRPWRAYGVMYLWKLARENGVRISRN